MKDLECRLRKISADCGIAAIDLEGGIFASNMEEFAELIETQQNSRVKNLILNLEKLDFISSSGIGLIVKKHEEFSKIGKRFWVAGLNDDIKKVFEQFALDTILAIAADEQQAVEKIKQANP
ncbi:MAG: STAS domain-containing protein [bacterium]